MPTLTTSASGSLVPNIFEEREEIMGFKIPKIFSTDFAVES